MNPLYMQVAHVLGVILFFAAAFVAFATPTPDKKRRMAMRTGILAVVVFVTGFGMLDMNGHASSENALRYPGWAFVKILAWLVVAVLGVAVFRSPGKAGLFGWLTALLAVLALVMVYFRPF